MPVHVLAEPTQQRRELPAPDVLEQGWVGPAGGFKELHGDDIAEGVSREVTDGAAGPVCVLHDTIRVGRRCDTQVRMHPFVPCLGEVLDSQRSFQQLLLKLVAQHDVEVVGDLIGLNADEAGLHAVYRPVERVELDLPQRRESALKDRVVVLPERPAAAH